MRMRKKWSAIPKLYDSGKALFWPEEFKGKWHEHFNNNNKIHLDIGCGSGDYSLHMAQLNPDINYILWDREPGVLIYALESLEELDLKNVIIIPREIDGIENIFEDGEIDSITIHFPNPWPKNRQNHRRLTYPLRLLKYKRVLKDGSIVDFRTDDDELYFDTINYIKKVGGEILNQSEDSAPTKVISHYEKRFRSHGVKIKSIRFNLSK